MTAPEGATRGRPASPETVQIYRILVKAAGALTVSQIAEQMPADFGPAAVAEYRAHKAKTDPTWLDGKSGAWSSGAEHEAMAWWVRQRVNVGRINGFWRPTDPRSRDGESTYLPGKPPNVQRTVLVEKTVMMPWTPELDEDDRTDDLHLITDQEGRR